MLRDSKSLVPSSVTSGHWCCPICGEPWEHELAHVSLAVWPGAGWLEMLSRVELTQGVSATLPPMPQAQASVSSVASREE